MYKMYKGASCVNYMEYNALNCRRIGTKFFVDQRLGFRLRLKTKYDGC